MCIRDRKEGRWLTAQQALDYGFIDEITEESGDSKINFTPELHRKFDMLKLPVDGIELPQQPDASAGSDETEPASILKRILNAVERWNKPKEKADDVTDSNTKTVMNQITKFTAILAAVGIASFEADASGSVTLSDEQLQAIEDKLNALASDVASRDNTIKDRDNEISGLKARVENLKNLPGDETSSVEADTEGAMSSEDVFNFVRDL